MPQKDIRADLCLAYYRNPNSDTFANLKGSAMKAGFNESYARVLTTKKPDWLTESLKKDIRRVQRAERNLDRYNDMEVNDLKSKTDIEKAKIQVGVSQFILKSQARQKWGGDGEQAAPNVQISIVNYNEKAQEKPEAREAETVDPQA